MCSNVRTGNPRLILVGLGNPGSAYADTRHNAGRLFVEHLQQRHAFGPFQPLEDAEAAEGSLAGMAAALVRPTVAMNESGRIVGPLLDRYGTEGRLYALAHDDLDVPVGSAKGRQKGGHGGHNGVRAVLEAAGDAPFFRVKLGVRSDRRRQSDSVADFLLSPFEEGEREKLEACFPLAEEILLGHLKSAAASQARGDRRRDVRARYVAEALDDVRQAIVGLEAVGAIRAASSYPVFLARDEAARLLDVTTALAKLLRKARRAAGQDESFYERVAAFIPEGLRPLLPPRSPSQRLFIAADFHVARGQIKAIELNCAAGYSHYARLADEAILPLLRDRLGGIERVTDAEFAPFLYEHGLKPLHEPARGAIAFLRGFGDRDMFNVAELEGLAGCVEAATGLPIPLCHESELELGADGLHLRDGRRVDLLYVEENLSEWGALGQGSRVLVAVREGLVKTFPPLDMFLFTSKGFLSLLSDPAVQELLAPDEAEAKALRENVLWSHPLDAHVEPVAYYMLDQGLTLVVKDALGGGGRGVTMLRPDSASQQTGHILRQRLRDGGSVVQGYFEAGRWSADSDLRFDVRVLAAAHEGDVSIGPVYGRVWRGEKLNFTGPDSGVVPVYVVD